MQKTTHVPSFLCSRLDEKIGLITHLSPGPGLQQPVFQCLHRRLNCVAAQQQAEGGIRPERSLHKDRPRPVWVARLVVPVRLSALSVLLCIWASESDPDDYLKFGKSFFTCIYTVSAVGCSLVDIR